jgi:hypothetical protein
VTFQERQERQKENLVLLPQWGDPFVELEDLKSLWEILQF